jgi:hypothetical protein
MLICVILYFYGVIIKMLPKIFHYPLFLWKTIYMIQKQIWKCVTAHKYSAWRAASAIDKLDVRERDEAATCVTLTLTDAVGVTVGEG